MIPVQNKLHNSSTNEVDKKHRPTWSVRDRTREFRATIESLNYSYTTRHDSDTNFKPKFNSHSRDEYSPLVPLHENPGQEIVDRATQVNVRIMATRTMLSSFIDSKCLLKHLLTMFEYIKLFIFRK